MVVCGGSYLPLSRLDGDIWKRRKRLLMADKNIKDSREAAPLASVMLEIELRLGCRLLAPRHGLHPAKCIKTPQYSIHVSDSR